MDMPSPDFVQSQMHDGGSPMDRPIPDAMVTAFNRRFAARSVDHQIDMPQPVGYVAPPPTAPQILDAAAGHMRDRAATYDSPQGERSMGRAVAALNAVLGRQALTESEGWLLLQLVKDVRDRQCAKPHRDSLEDGVAYAALKAEARLQEGGAA